MVKVIGNIEQGKESPIKEAGKMEHTKEKWEVYHNKHGWHCDVNGVGRVCMIDTEANAHLISASPDMYEALKGLLRDYSTNPLDDDFFNACLEARQALAKAEGK